MQKINKKGVTLLELVIVMVIVALGAVLIAPNIGGWLSHYRLRGATRDVVSTMRTAQMKAVSQNLAYCVSFNIGPPGSYVLQRNSAGNWLDEGAVQILPTGITIGNILGFPEQGGRRIAQFNPNSTSSAGSVTLNNPKGGVRKIVITAATGRVRIE